MINNNNLKEINFSIIIPTYNRSYELEILLKSFQKQLFKSFEIIIVDDGSQEEIFPLVKKFYDLNIKYYKIENSERGKARNYGYLKSSGMYLNFFDLMT